MTLQEKIAAFRERWPYKEKKHLGLAWIQYADELLKQKIKWCFCKSGGKR